MTHHHEKRHHHEKHEERGMKRHHKIILGIGFVMAIISMIAFVILTS